MEKEQSKLEKYQKEHDMLMDELKVSEKTLMDIQQANQQKIQRILFLKGAIEALSPEAKLEPKLVK